MQSTIPRRLRRRISVRRATGAALLATLAAAGPAAAHGGHDSSAATAGPAAVKFRGCWMSVAYVPRPAEALREAFRRPPDLIQTFYGPDPLLGFWAVSCKGARVGAKPVGPITLSAVGVPVGLTVFGAPALANFFSHSLLRVDTNSQPLAAALRHRRLPVHLARRARYLHSPPGALPSAGSLTVPGRYGLRVSAHQPDPTNPHDHDNRFVWGARNGLQATLGLSTADASDRFCFPAAGDCTATVNAPPGSSMASLLGGRTVTARVGFDHERVPRIQLVAGKGATR